MFIDANVVLYAAGAAHRYKAPCEAVLAVVAREPSPCFTSTEVLQEVLNVYIRRGDRVRATAAIAAMRELLGPKIVSVLPGDVYAAAANQQPGLQARDLVHLATMARLGLTRIISTDRAFDGVAGIDRLDPARFAEWRDTVFSA